MEKAYRVIRSNRKTVSIQIKPDGEVVVRAPRRMPLRQIEGFVAEKQGWIAKHLPSGEQQPKLTAAELSSLIRQAKDDIPQRVARFAPLVGVTYGRISIRHQHTRWGSCSAKGNLNFNCLLILSPEKVRDYVVVHELCHRKEMNHSPLFWAEVERILPEYREYKRWLKDHGQSLIARLE